MAKHRPAIDAQQPTFDAMERAKGKTIADFYLETVPGNSDAHQTERLTISFTDGSTLSIDTGSNAVNLISKYKDFKASDFRVDLFAYFNT